MEDRDQVEKEQTAIAPQFHPSSTNLFRLKSWRLWIGSLILLIMTGPTIVGMLLS